MKIKTTKSENNLKKGGQCYEFINQELILTSPCEMRIKKGPAITVIILTGVPLLREATEKHGRTF